MYESKGGVEQMITEPSLEVESFKKPKSVERQLNLDDVFGTNYGFDKLEPIDNSDNSDEPLPSDYETFVNMLKKTEFMHGFEERRGIIQMNELGDCYDVNTKEIVLVQSNGLRTVAMFCESDESLLGFIIEDIT